MAVQPSTRPLDFLSASTGGHCGRGPDQLLYCCHKSADTVHDVEVPFRRCDLHLVSCLHHAVLKRIGGLNDRTGVDVSAMVAYVKGSDGKRGKTVVHEKTLAQAVGHARQLLWDRVDFGWATARKQIVKRKIRETLAPSLDQIGMR